MSETMQGKRVYANSEGWLPSLAPGEYGKATHKDVVNTYLDRWIARCPDGSNIAINPHVHKIIEHDDGSISVTPSIVSSTWHGWLEKGVWRSV